MEPMSDDELRAFLTDRPRTAVLATTRADGRPHAAPVWFDVDDDGSLVLTTGADTVKGRTIRRDPRVVLCVEDESPPFAFAAIEGLAEIDPDPDELRRWATRIGGRYMGADRAEEYGRRNGVPGELLVRVRPAHVVAVSGVAD
jgi:hypothetical protein